MAYVPVPKDLTKVKTKVMFNLTKRQLVCFGSGALLGVPLFFLLKGPVGTSTAAMCMVILMLPFFLLGYYLDPWINWSRHYLLLGSVAALFVLTYLVRLLFLHDPVVTWHPASGTLLKPFFHLLNIKLPG